MNLVELQFNPTQQDEPTKELVVFNANHILFKNIEYLDLT